MRCHFVVIFIVISILIIIHGDRWGSNDQVSLITDMSTSCIENLHTDIYLPIGMGVADANVVIISDNDKYPNCVLMFCTNNTEINIYMVVVVEFPDHTLDERNASQNHEHTILINDPHLGKIDVYYEVNQMGLDYETAAYTMLSNSSNISLTIFSNSTFETVKITVTSARRLTEYGKCDATKEVLCLIANASVCISAELLCDKNINCGVPFLYDEDVRICDAGRYERLWVVVVLGAIMIIIVVFFLMHLLKACLPAVPDNFFIFNEDEDNKLILSTRFVAPSESLRELTARRVATESSSFTFKAVPVNNPDNDVVSTPSPSIKQFEKNPLVDTNKNLNSEEEIEVGSELYTKVAKNGKDRGNNIKAEADKKLRKPRFNDVNFIQIMDRIEEKSQVDKGRQPGAMANRK